MLQRLGAQSLASVDDSFHWSATAYGMALAQNLGPANVPKTYTAPALTSHDLLAQQTPSRRRLRFGNGDIRPPVLRPGAEVALALPSRYGDTLVYADGRREQV